MSIHSSLKLPAKLELKYILMLFAVLLALILIFWPSSASTKNSLGSCLSLKKVVMYGVDTCPNCINQKNIFGKDFKNVNYVNCDFHEDECHKKGISVYPVWSMDNRVLIGTQSLSALADFASCPLSSPTPN